MDDHLKIAIELAKSQASVRVMQEDEIMTMIQSLAASLKTLTGECGCPSDDTPAGSNTGSIKEKTITCLECGKSFKLITKKHLAKHGLDADSYRQKWGLKSDTPLVCKSLQRVRRKKMKTMKLWEKRRGATS